MTLESNIATVLLPGNLRFATAVYVFTRYGLFYQQGFANGPMDYKSPQRWFASSLSSLAFPSNNGEEKEYIAFGRSMSASNLGNLNFAIVGKSLRIPKAILIWQAGAAHLRDHPPYHDFLTSQIKSIQERENGWGDSENCTHYIDIGFKLFSKLP